MIPVCGRFTLAVSEGELRSYLQDFYTIERFPDSFGLPRYNIAPGQDVVAVVGTGKDQRAGLLRWGYIPPFIKDVKKAKRLINARGETLAEKPSFRDSFLHRRCIVIADGFYEWKRTATGKTPYRFVGKRARFLPFAGLWSTHDQDGMKLHTCTIVTTEANDIVKRVHERMPVILDEKACKTWLDPRETDTHKMNVLIAPFPTDELDSYPVSSVVNSPAHDSEDCIKEDANPLIR